LAEGLAQAHRELSPQHRVSRKNRTFGVAFAGIVRSPMTSVFQVFEVTHDYAIIVPLMTANLVSYFVSRKLSEETPYEGISRQDGIHLPTARSHAARTVRQVAQIMRPVEHVLNADMTVNDALTLTSASGLRSWPVLSDESLSGVTSSQSLQQLQAEGKGDLPLRRVTQSFSFPHLHRDHSLNLPLERMGAAGLDALPVVDRFNAHEMVGIVYLSDILAAYHLPMSSASASILIR
jgi:chloride channel protein, CIC family